MNFIGPPIRIVVTIDSTINCQTNFWHISSRFDGPPSTHTKQKRKNETQKAPPFPTKVDPTGLSRMKCMGISLRRIHNNKKYDAQWATVFKRVENIRGLLKIEPQGTLGCMRIMGDRR